MASPHGSPHLSSGASGASGTPVPRPTLGGAAEAALAGDLRVLTPERVGLQYATAGIGSRCTAALIDTAIQSLVLTVVGAILFFTVFSPPATGNRPAPAAGGAAGTTLPSAFWIG